MQGMAQIELPLLGVVGDIGLVALTDVEGDTFDDYDLGHRGRLLIVGVAGIHSICIIS